MSSINLDTSAKLNLECVAKDTFTLNLEVKNDDGSDYVFQEASEVSQTGEYVLFSVLDFEKEPIMVCFSRNNINAISFNESTLPDNPFYSPSHHYPLVGDAITSRLTGERYAYAVSNALNTDKKLITGVYEKGEYRQHTQDYLLVTKNFRLNPPVLVASPKFSYELFEPCITVSDGLIQINIQSYVFDLPEGKYDYNIKILSDLNNYDLEYNNPANTSFKKSKTWMHGSLTVKKL